MWRYLRYISVRAALAAASLSLFTASCGTGIEVTDHVTDKDVRRVIEEVDSRQQQVTLEAYRDSIGAWELGKRFWVSDDQVKELLAVSSAYDKDTLRLAGRIVLYQGWTAGGLYTDNYNGRWLDLDLVDSLTGASYCYRAGKEVEVRRRGFTFPMLIDMDMVEHYARQIVDKDFYIRTPIWYDRVNEQMMNGRHFIKVHIDSVLPGNAVFPLRVLFTAETNERAMVWLSCGGSSSMLGRDFDSLFSLTDPHLSYPAITGENWELITRSRVVEGMTKEECRLALGKPNSINENPDPSGMKEYWYYDGGSYLYFVDGLLNQFRR